MKRLFIVAAALTVVTAGVMANAKKFVNAGLYAQTGASTYVQITNAETFNRDLTLSATGSQAQIIGSQTGNAENLWYDNGSGTKQAVYSQSF